MPVTWEISDQAATAADHCIHTNRRPHTQHTHTHKHTHSRSYTMHARCTQRIPALCTQEEAEDLIDDRDVEIPDQAATAADHANFRRLHRQQEERSAEEIAKYIEERYR